MRSRNIFKPVVGAIEVSHAACKDEFDEMLDLTADVFLNFTRSKVDMKAAVSIFDRILHAVCKDGFRRQKY